MKIIIVDSDLRTGEIVAAALESWLSGSGFDCIANAKVNPFTSTTKAARKRYQLGRVEIAVSTS